MTLLIIGLIMLFASVGLIVWHGLPAGVEAAKIYHGKNIHQTTRALDNMFMDVSKRRLNLLLGFAPLAVGLAILAATKNFWLGVCFGGLGVLVPKVVLKLMDMRRREKFAQQLVDGLMVLSSSLKGGLSLTQSIEELVDEMPAPINQEFGLVLKENRIGIPLDESLEKLNRRMKNDDLNLMITAILVARETGGNLSEPFEMLVFTIRERAKLYSKLKNLTIQAKLQGILMSLLPVAFAYVVYKWIKPDYFDFMLRDRVGQTCLAVAAVLEIVGAYFLWKFSQVEV
jgi:tight adherence protein B